MYKRKLRSSYFLLKINFSKEIISIGIKKHIKLLIKKIKILKILIKQNLVKNHLFFNLEKCNKNFRKACKSI